MTVPPSDDPVVAALRSAGCVFAEDEAAILRESALNEEHLGELVRRRVSGEPLEPLVGWVGFMGHRLSLAPGVFVPRQRTRLLAVAAVTAVRRVRGRPLFVEAFAGVAPVAVAVHAAIPDAEIHVTDIDERALAHARHQLPAADGVHAGSVLDGLPGEIRGRIDVIAAVPPYVPDGEAEFLPREARDFEPASALFGGVDGLDPVRALSASAPAWLRPHGRVLVEMNHVQCDDAAAHAERHGFRARVIHSDDGQTAVLVLSAGYASR